MLSDSELFKLETKDLSIILENIQKKNAIEPDEKIIRYMNFAKLISLLETKRLFLARADKFEDLDEGLLPNGYISINKTEGDEIDTLPKINHETIYEDIKRAKQNTYINSWNILKSESYALWKIYGEKYGVAIQSDYEKIQALLKTKKADIRKVVYLDEDDIYLHASPDNIPISILDFFSLKKKHYSYEEEIRIILFDDGNDVENTIKIENIQDLVSKIYVSPFAEEWFVDLVRSIVQKRYKLPIEVVKSKINVNS